MNAVMIGNFDITETTQAVTFPHTGTWYNYFSGTEFNVSSTTASILLKPGEYRLYTDYKIDNDNVTGVEGETIVNGVYPNPAKEWISVDFKNETVKNIQVYSQTGQKFTLKQISNDKWDTRELPAGLYILRVTTSNGIQSSKLIKTSH
jgi:hypothetical protein